MGLGQSVRLASVRCLTLPSRRKDSRRRIHGGELRLATVSMYMAIKRAQIDIKNKIKIHNYMATYLCQKTRESSIEAIQRTIAQSKFSLEHSLFSPGSLDYSSPDDLLRGFSVSPATAVSPGQRKRRCQ